MKDIQWLLEAIEEAGKTAVKEDGTCWRASYTKEDKAVVELLKGYMESMGMDTFLMLSEISTVSYTEQKIIRL